MDRRWTFLFFPSLISTVVSQSTFPSTYNIILPSLIFALKVPPLLFFSAAQDASTVGHCLGVCFESNYQNWRNIIDRPTVVSASITDQMNHGGTCFPPKYWKNQRCGSTVDGTAVPLAGRRVRVYMGEENPLGWIYIGRCQGRPVVEIYTTTWWIWATLPAGHSI
jgi:hypothetical protein